MTAPAKRLFLVRHCDVHNPKGVIYGHLPNFHLSEKGVRQAHALGKHFASRPIRRIRTSPLLRATQTAEIIASYLPDATVTTTDDLIESGFALYLQGTPRKLIPFLRPYWIVHMLMPGLLKRDESVPMMAQRVRHALGALLQDDPSEEAICVSHGDPIQAFWVEATHRHPYALHRLQCAKGGRLNLTYHNEELQRIQYVPPSEATPAPRH